MIGPLICMMWTSPYRRPAAKWGKAGCDYLAADAPKSFFDVHMGSVLWPLLGPCLQNSYQWFSFTAHLEQTLARIHCHHCNFEILGAPHQVNKERFIPPTGGCFREGTSHRYRERRGALRLVGQWPFKRTTWWSSAKIWVNCLVASKWANIIATKPSYCIVSEKSSF